MEIGDKDIDQLNMRATAKGKNLIVDLGNNTFVSYIGYSRKIRIVKDSEVKEEFEVEEGYTVREFVEYITCKMR
jgi:hypothetical protein